MVDIQSNILEKLHCSKCNAYLSFAPIMITEDGENLCGRCVDENSNKKLIRNKAYEDFAAIGAFPCRYKESGCDVVVPWEDVIFHEDHCEYRLYKCPVATTGTCDWEGYQNNLMDHYKETHPELILEHPCSLDTDIVVDNDKNMLLSFLGFIFLVQIRCNTGLSKLWHCVHCFTHPKIAQQFSFSVRFSNNEKSVETVKPVLAERYLTMQLDKSIETNVNYLLGILGDYKNIKCVLSIIPKVCSDLQNVFLYSECKDSKLPAVFRNNDKSYCENCKQQSLFNDSNMKYLYKKVLKPCRNNIAGCPYFNNNIKLVKRHVKWECKWQQKCVLGCELGFDELEKHFVNNKTHIRKLDTELKMNSWYYGQIKKDNNNVTNILYKCLMKPTSCELYIYTQLDDIHLYTCQIKFDNHPPVTLQCSPTADHDWELCQTFGKNPYLYGSNTFYIMNISISKNQ